MLSLRNKSRTRQSEAREKSLIYWIHQTNPELSNYSLRLPLIKSLRCSQRIPSNFIKRNDMAENAPVNKLVSLLSLRQSSSPPRLPTASLLASFTALLSPLTRTSLINYTPYLFINLCHMKDPLIKIKSFKFIKFLFSSLFASFVWRDGLRSLSVRDFSYKFSAPRRRLLNRKSWTEKEEVIE